MARKPANDKSKTDGTKTRRVSHKGARAKGSRGEAEFCQFMSELGIPTQRVLASGALKFSGADSDVKVGIVPNPDGSYPPADETSGILRAEVKNKTSSPDFHPEFESGHLDIVMTNRKPQEQQWKDVNQSKSTRVLALRRPKIPQGAIAEKRYGEIFGVFMDIEVFADLLRRAYPDRVFYIPESEPAQAA